MNLQQAIAAVQPPCEDSREAARRRFSDIAIPLGSLGLLQDAVAAVAMIDLVLAAYDGMPSFDEAGIEAYQPLT